MIEQEWLQKPPLGVPINWGHLHSTRQVGCYLLNEGSGSRVNDLSGTANAGTLGGDATWGIGEKGPHLAFAGVDGRAALTYSNPFFDCGLAPLSVMAIAKTSAHAETYGNMFRYDNSNANGLFGLRIGLGKLQFLIADAARTVASVSSTANWNDGNWHSFVGTRIGASMNVYVDGVDAGNGITTGADKNIVAASAALAAIGALWNSASSAWTEEFIGSIACVYVAYEGWSPSTVQSLHIRPYAMFDWPRLWAVAAAAGNWLRSPFDAGFNVKNPVYDYGWQ